MSSHVIDVAIGMAYVFLTFSLICTVVNEMIAGVLTLREKNLELGIKSLFSEDVRGADDADSFTNKVYSHALVRGLYRGVERKAEDFKRGVFGRIKLPSYIPAGTFATALIDSIAPGASSAANPFAEVQTAIQKLPDSTTKKALLSLTLTAQGKLEDFQKNVEGWFNDSMDRASGWYKRQTKKILLVIAFAVTIAANADSVNMVKTLWNDPTVLKNSIDAANKYMESAKDKNDKNESGQAANLKDLEKKINTLANDLPAGLPIGWKENPFMNLCKADCFSWNSLQVLFGWIFTALALSLGAPFWFDVLNKFMVVRSTVKPKEKAGKATKG
jgi:hypothetical protein